METTVDSTAEQVAEPALAHIRRGAQVAIGFQGKVLNACYDGPTLIGYRVSDGSGFWAIVPVSAVTELP